METRWSSPAADPQWLQIDLGSNTVLHGAILFWETAYARDYTVSLSPDGMTWQQVYATTTGNGGRDEIFFAPTPARFFKLTGLRRSTGWGYSLWEIVLKTDADRLAVSGGGDDPFILFDGEVDRCLSLSSPPPCQIQLDLAKPTTLGGLRIDWGPDYGQTGTLEVSDDGMAWTNLAILESGAGKFDLLTWPARSIRCLRWSILQSPTSNQPPQIAELTLLGPDESPNAMTLYEMAAAKAPSGWYPDSLNKRQVYWTIVGTPYDSAEGLFDEYGNLEPRPKQHTIMPYVMVQNRLYGALDGVVTQSLAEGYMPLPTVTRMNQEFSLTIQPLAMGSATDSVILTRYQLANGSGHELQGNFYLAIRPVQINPPWQYGGLAPADSMSATNESAGFVVRIDEHPFLLSVSRPAACGFRAFDRGDIIENIARENLPAAQRLDQPDSLLSGALRYPFSLPPGAVANFLIATPLHAFFDGARFQDLDDSVFTRLQTTARADWRALLNRATIELPDRALTDTLKSQLAYTLINRDRDAIQPGSRQYERSWIRDGSMTIPLLMRLGHPEIARAFIDWYAHFITPEGMVPPSFRADDPLDAGPGSGIEWDGQGAFIYMVMEYVRFTHDREFLRGHYGKLTAVMDFMAALRERTLQPGYEADRPDRNRLIGILPKSYSHEGYDPPMHSYWDDAWALRGWRDGLEAARMMGDTGKVAWAAQQYHMLKESVRKSMAATIAAKSIRHIPGCAEKGDYDPTSTAIFFDPCMEAGVLPSGPLRDTYERYFSELFERRQPGWGGAFTGYEARNITAFAELDQPDRVAFMLDFMQASRRPPAWNHLAEVVLGDPRVGSYIGDMPHTWAGASLFNAVSRLLIREEDSRLILLKGIPGIWALPGQALRLTDVPTHFGSLNLNVRFTEKEMICDLDLARTAAPAIELGWGRSERPARVTLDGQAWTNFDRSFIRVPADTRHVRAAW